MILNSLRGWRCGVMALGLWGASVGGRAEPIDPRWEPEIAKFSAQERVAPSPDGVILFTGSSSIRRWDTLAEDFSQHAVVNRGFGGSQISDLIAYFDRVFGDVKPKQIVIYAGTNDLNAGESVEHVLGDLATLCGMLNLDSAVEVAGKGARR